MKVMDVERNHARNEGLKLAQGDIIVFIDSDIVIYPNSLQRVADYFDQNPKISAATSIVSIKYLNNNFLVNIKINIWIDQR